jgi:hypothetical protein
MRQRSDGDKPKTGSSVAGLLQWRSSEFNASLEAVRIMQRDMDLVRTILIRIEAHPSGWAVEPFGIVGYTPEEVGYHVRIMMEDGLIEGARVTPRVAGGVFRGKPLCLTWMGHEFLDLARDQNRWNQGKAVIAQIGSAPIAVWMKVLNDLLLKELGVAS